MSTCDTLINVTGQHLLFIGVDSASWTLAQFASCAQFAKNSGVDSVLLKVADGTNVWYGGMDGYHTRKSIFTSYGVGTIPYTYSYCTQFSALDSEIDILINFMQDGGVVCMDAETEWNGQVAAAQHFTLRMRPVPGKLLVTTWADPQWQNWLGVLGALLPCVDGWMPQVYSSQLEGLLLSVIPSFGCLIPTVSVLPISATVPNDPVGIAGRAYASGDAALAVWHYDTASQNVSLFLDVLSAFPKKGGNVPVYAGPIKQSLDDQWNRTLVTPTPSIGTAIHAGWVQARLLHGWCFGAPTSAEYSTVDFNNSPIVAMDFGPIRAEWNNVATPQLRWFGPAGEIFV